MNNTRKLVYTALLAALTAAGAFMRIPMGYSSVTLQYLFTAMAGLLLGLWLGSLLFPGEALAALCALLLMGGGGLALKALDPHLRKKQAFQPRILAVYQEGERKNGTDADEG